MYLVLLHILKQKKIAEIISKNKGVCKAFHVLNAMVKIITGRKTNGVMSAKTVNIEHLFGKEQSWNCQNCPL